MLARFLYLTTLTLPLRFSTAAGPTCSKINVERKADNSMQQSIVFVTAPNETVAKGIARGLIRNKLAACVNLIPGITSIYEWENELNEDKEILMIIKTRTARITELSDYVVKNHPYKVCEVISTSIENGNPSYLQWILAAVPETQSVLIPPSKQP